eukprot:scaffold30124_cov39-Tisochrysis_lutea.AAC.1
MGAFDNLKDLDLKSTNIGDEGMVVFAKAVSEGALKNLTTLDLGCNEIGEKGIKAFAEAIAKGARNLKEIALSHILSKPNWRRIRDKDICRGHIQGFLFERK